MTPYDGQETACVRARQAVRQFFIGRVESKLPCSHEGKTKRSSGRLSRFSDSLSSSFSTSRFSSFSARSRSSIRATRASAFNGMTRDPAFVFVEERRIVMVIAVQSTAFHRSPRNSQLRQVVFSQNGSAVGYLPLCFVRAISISFSFSSWVSTRASFGRSGNIRTSSAIHAQARFFFRMRRRSPISRFTVRPDTSAMRAF